MVAMVTATWAACVYSTWAGLASTWVTGLWCEAAEAWTARIGNLQSSGVTRRSQREARKSYEANLTLIIVCSDGGRVSSGG